MEGKTLANVSLKSLHRAMLKAEEKWNQTEAGERPLSYEDLVALWPGDKVMVSCLGAGRSKNEPMPCTVVSVEPCGWTDRYLPWGAGGSWYSEPEGDVMNRTTQAQLLRVYRINVALPSGDVVGVMAGLGRPVVYRGWRPTE
jgi:hypothetical protein